MNFPQTITEFLDKYVNMSANSDFWLRIVKLVKPFFIGLDILLLIGIVLVLMKVIKFRPNLRLNTNPQKKIFTLREALFRERWQNVAEKFSSGRMEAMKLAIIEADKLADNALKDSGLLGEHMADRLAQIKSENLASLQGLWRAHQLRNELVHQTGFQLSENEAKRAMAGYEAFFRETGLLQS